MSKYENLTFLLADDHSVVRLGMQIKISALVKNPIFFHSSTYRETIKILQNNPIDILILDINFPDGNSTSRIADIFSIQPSMKILMFSASDEDIYAVRYLQEGVNGYLNKLSSDAEIEDALQIFFETGKYISQTTKDKIFYSLISNKKTNPLDQLSNRETEIALYLIKGHSNNDIAELLKLKNSTVSTYKKRIYEKLDIENLCDLMELFKVYFKNY